MMVLVIWIVVVAGWLCDWLVGLRGEAVGHPDNPCC